MLSSVFALALAAFAFASTCAVATGITTRTEALTLPQCANLTLSWANGVAPYTAVITDEDGLTETIKSTKNKLVWAINFPAYTQISFVITDATNTTSGGGPYEVVKSGVTSCLCSTLPFAKRADTPSDILSERFNINLDLPTLSSREATDLTPVNARGLDNGGSSSPWSFKYRHNRRKVHHKVCPKYL